jgi:hypothetical protein
MTTFEKPIELIFNKLGEVLNIFDLSFFISGITFISGILYIDKLTMKVLNINYYSVVNIIGIIIACYISGLVCFSLGRKIQRGITEKCRRNIQMEFDKDLVEAVKDHGLGDKHPFWSYLNSNNLSSDDKGKTISRLYIRMWAEARQRPDLSKSLVLLNRYWVMSATYDGMIIALFPWAIVLFLGLNSHFKVTWVIRICIGVAVLGIYLFIGLTCISEGKKNKTYQMEELTSTLSCLDWTSTNIKQNADLSKESVNPKDIESSISK